MLESTSTGIPSNFNKIFPAKDYPGEQYYLRPNPNSYAGTDIASKTENSVLLRMNIPQGELFGGQMLRLRWETDAPDTTEILEIVIYEDDIQITTLGELILSHNNSEGVTGYGDVYHIFQHTSEYVIEVKTRNILGYYVAMDIIQLFPVLTEFTSTGDEGIPFTDSGTGNVTGNGTSNQTVTASYLNEFIEAPIVTCNAQSSYLNVGVTPSTSTTGLTFNRIDGATWTATIPYFWIAKGVLETPVIIQ